MLASYYFTGDGTDVSANSSHPTFCGSRIAFRKFRYCLRVLVAFFQKIYLLIYLRGSIKGRERWRWRSFMLWFTPQMAAMTRAGPRASSGYLPCGWPYCAAFAGALAGSLIRSASAGILTTLIWDAGIAGLTCCTMMSALLFAFVGRQARE